MDAGELDALAGILSGLTLREWDTVRYAMDRAFSVKRLEVIKRAVDGVGSCGMDAPQLSEKLARGLLGEHVVVDADHGQADGL